MSCFDEKVLSSEKIYEGKIVNLRVDTVVFPDGRTGTREVVEISEAVAVVPLTDKEELLLVRQYRHPVGKTLLEIPAGKLEPGEDPLDCARRELLEETGYEAGSMTRLFSFFSTPGFTPEELHLFMAGGLVLKEQNLDEDEFIDVVKVPLSRALEMVWNGEICDAKSVIGILAAGSLKK
ncbi:NTP pyrophosphohydrolases [Pelotomaculum thermopropionicum SI]|uniref:NTP pyrophosphohydrolases n=1 Tax=Pelotomaculum thermopropionicum (strain DSM 13744 / JCM 10971 / SI) TaxID=370438 RepID=A5D2M6_PELTS|nr:NTP pyrophosphohydrolases [Pelotomaculum thermopropionicum SI]